MFHLADWIVTAVAGPILVLAVAGAFTAIIRNRMDARRIDSLEADMANLDDLPKRLSVLENVVKMKMVADQEATKRNDAAHERIEQTQERHRQEHMEQLRELKADLIREFRRNNGNNNNNKVKTT